MQKNNNGLYYYKLNSPYCDDETKNRELTDEELDLNFLHLKNEDISSGSLNINERKILLKKKDGQVVDIDLRDLAKLIKDETNVSINNNLNDFKEAISGIVTNEIQNWFRFKIASTTKLDDYNPSLSGVITKNDTINSAISKLSNNENTLNKKFASFYEDGDTPGSIQNYIKLNNETLKKSDYAVESSFVTEVSETNGIIDVKRGKVTSNDGGIIISSSEDGGIDLSVSPQNAYVYGQDAIEVSTKEDGKYISLVIDPLNEDSFLSITSKGLKLNGVEEALNTKVNKANIVQTKGESELDIMSQKAVSDIITSTITQVTESSNILDAKINALALGAKSNTTVSPTYIYMDVDTTISISGSFTSNGDIIASKIKINDGTSDIASNTGNTVQTTQPITLSSATGVASKVYKTISYYNEAEFISTATVSARYPILYGFGFKPEDANNKLSARASAVTTYTVTATADNQHLYICVPPGINALTSFTMNGAPAVFNSTNQLLNEVQYKVYTSGGIYDTNTTLNIEAK